MAQQHPVIAGVHWILENRADPSTGKPWSKRGLSVAAGLSEKYVEQLLAAGPGRKPINAANVGMKVLQGLARAGRVPIEFMLAGAPVPEPDPGLPRRPERTVEAALEYASLRQWLRFAGGAGRELDPDVVAEMRAYRGAEGDPGADDIEFWTQLYRDLSARRKKVLESLRGFDDLE